MKINFTQLLTPGQEVILADGQPLVIGKSYDNYVVYDDNLSITFKPDGMAHLELKSWARMTPQQRYIEGNNFLNSLFDGRIAVTKREEKDKTVFFGYFEATCKVSRGDKVFKRTLNIDNGYFVYKDGHDEHQGIDFYIEETDITAKAKKKRKAK